MIRGIFILLIVCIVFIGGAFLLKDKLDITAVENFNIVVQPVKAPYVRRSSQAFNTEETHDDRSGNRIDEHEQQTQDCGHDEQENHQLIFFHSDITSNGSHN